METRQRAINVGRNINQETIWMYPKPSTSNDAENVEMIGGLPVLDVDFPPRVPPRSPTPEAPPSPTLPMFEFEF